MKFNNTKKILTQAKKLIPNACQTLSKGYRLFIIGDFPLYVKKAEGCHIWDVDNNKYIDYTSSLGSIILGYNVPEINKAIQNQLKLGITFSLPHQIETRLAKKITDTIPGAHMVRFAKSGHEATSAAVRIARAYTGREVILRSGYHGGQDWYLASQPPQDWGVPKSMKKHIDVFKYNDLNDLKSKIKKHKNKVAAIIMEPVPLSDPAKGYLESVQKIAKQNKIVLIFDEMVTAYRMHLGGAQAYYKITPDLTCIGKAMGNGMPISAVCGKREIMQATEQVFVSTNFGGETLSMAASIAVIDYIKKHKVIEHTHKMGQLLYKGLNDLIKKHNLNAEIIGQPFKFKILFHNKDKSESNIKRLFFLQQGIYHGIFFGPVVTFSYAHTKKEIDYTLKATAKIFKAMADNNDDEKKLKKLIKGQIPVNNFKRDQR